MELSDSVSKQAPYGDWERWEFTGNDDHFVSIRSSVNWGRDCGGRQLSTHHTVLTRNFQETWSCMVLAILLNNNPQRVELLWLREPGTKLLMGV